jgi:hypothetical protein
MISKCAGQESYCVIGQDVWLVDICSFTVVISILYFRAANIFPAGPNWALSLYRLGTGAWGTISMNVLPVTVMLEVLILTCKSAKWIMNFCTNIPYFHKKAHSILICPWLHDKQRMLKSNSLKRFNSLIDFLCLMCLQRWNKQSSCLGILQSGGMDD